MAVGQRQDGRGGNALYVARYSSTGRLLWRTAEGNGTVSQPAEGLAVTTDPKADVYVAGTLAGPTGTQPVVVKYSGTTGKRLWLAAPDPRAGVAEAIALDGKGDVTVSGYVLGDDGPHGWVARLDGTAGTVRWTWAPAPGDIRAVAVDGNADVYGTGRLVAVKLSGATGDTLWQVRSAAPASAQLGFPLMRAVSVDRGRVLVAGALRDSLQDTRAFYAAALSPDTGAFLWEHAGSPTFGGDTASAIASDPSGSLFVAGELNGMPAVQNLNGGDGSAVWTVEPWPAGAAPCSVPAVAALCADPRAVYVSGLSTAGSAAVTAVTRTGTRRWTVSLGVGTVTAQAMNSRGQLFIVGAFTARGGSQQTAIVGLTGATGRDLPGRAR